MTHRDQVEALLRQQIADLDEVREIGVAAGEVASRWVDPLGADGQANGLIYGLVQSGKTGVLTYTGAIAADDGYRTLVVLTSDSNPLYSQTLARVRTALPGMDIIGKTELKDAASFAKRIRAGACAVVVTKNSSVLKAVIENFAGARLTGLSCLIMDDEADQATPNTRAWRDDGTRSRINKQIADLRAFFKRNTYLQVTATPQALFLQPMHHELRPKFTVLSKPGADYVGGEEFFGDNAQLVNEFPGNDLSFLAPGSQPTPRVTSPASLLKALDCFMVGATFKRLKEPDQNCAFLCHVSARTTDHRHMVEVMRKYKSDLAVGLRDGENATLARIKAAYEDLRRTCAPLGAVDARSIIEKVSFFAPGIDVKLVNGQTDEDVAVTSPYSLFVGGNKLGRGVTIRNLLVSYYGRASGRPQADTVLQHARMYGYRRKDLGLLRLFLPPEIHRVFRAVHKMERDLRDLLARDSGEGFRGIYLEGKLTPTRRSVLVPGAMGVYSAGSTYNPHQVRRDASAAQSTARIDKLLEGVPDRKLHEFPVATMASIIELVPFTEDGSERIWDPSAIAGALRQVERVLGHKTGVVYVDRHRALEKGRRETQGILSGGEANALPRDKVSLALTRNAAGACPAWWPQVRFPDGSYAVAFTI
ncbi:MAG: Z1 domain-containing protein [Terriglobales bacterium]